MSNAKPPGGNIRVQVYDRFSIALKHSGLTPFRYHDLRHYAASKMHAEGIPELYIEAIGGWKPGSSVLRRVYENVIDSEMTKIEESFAEKNRFSFLKNPRKPA